MYSCFPCLFPVTQLMKCIYCLLAFSLLISQFRIPVTAQALTPEQTRADFSYLKRKLDQLHPGVGFYTPRPQLEQLYDSLYNRLTAPVDYLTFFRHVSPFVMALKDGHTNLNHRKNYISKTTRFIPFFIRPVGERYYISHNVSVDTSLRRGTELLTINGRTVADLHREQIGRAHV